MVILLGFLYFKSCKFPATNPIIRNCWIIPHIGYMIKIGMICQVRFMVSRKYPVVTKVTNAIIPKGNIFNRTFLKLSVLNPQYFRIPFVFLCRYVMYTAHPNIAVRMNVNLQLRISMKMNFPSPVITTALISNILCWSEIDLIVTP